MTLFTKRGNTAGFDAAGRTVIGWYGKDKRWHVAAVGENNAEYLTNGTHRVFDTLDDASAHAMTLIDPVRTAELRWW